MDDFVWLDMIMISVPLALEDCFGSEVVHTLSCRCTSLSVTVSGVIFPFCIEGNRIIMMSILV
ncbi:hypothetical protein Fmac_021206 [Flemingia macrophylla]|uniref:Uncharacterized protein n=1 Tax=Flemingia macrophylla TaxID=520843 RepID=A0ABD1LW92_9FABA